MGGGTAIQYDYAAASRRDIKIIVPVALVLIAVILAILLQAIVAPLFLIADGDRCRSSPRAASRCCSSATSSATPVDPVLPLIVFIFLVALGSDYNIFLMSRVREEARAARHERGHAARAQRDRPGDHERGPDPRGHVLRAVRCRSRTRSRSASRSASGCCSTRSSCGRSSCRRRGADRRQDLVAVDSDGGQPGQRGAVRGRARKGAGGGRVNRLSLGSSSPEKEPAHGVRVPDLPYDYNALEPHIDEETMRVHHDKHHQAYVDKVNAALEGTEWADKPIEEVLKNLDRCSATSATRCATTAAATTTTRSSGSG